MTSTLEQALYEVADAAIPPPRSPRPRARGAGTAPSERRLAEGTEVVFVPGVEVLWHLPVAGVDSNERRTLCGLAGHLYVYGPIARQRRCCSVCADRAAAGTFLRPPKVRRVTSRSVPVLTEPQVQVLYRLYVDKVIGISAIGEMVWQRLGFKSPTSCANAINRAFHERGLTVRPRAASRRRSLAGKRLIGVGGIGAGERRLTGPILDELYEQYRGGLSVPELARLRACEFGYDEVRFRGVVEYGWKVCGYERRSNSEAELLSRSKATEVCVATTSGASGYRPRPCTQRALAGSKYCFTHDPGNADRIAQTVEQMQSRIKRAPALDFAEISDYLGPLLVPRADRLGRRLEQASGALHRQTGVPGSVCSRLLNGRKTRISEATAGKLLAPLGLTLDQIRRGYEEVAA